MEQILAISGVISISSECFLGIPKMKRLIEVYTESVDKAIAIRNEHLKAIEAAGCRTVAFETQGIPAIAKRIKYIESAIATCKNASITLDNRPVLILSAELEILTSNPKLINTDELIELVNAKFNSARDKLGAKYILDFYNINETSHTA